VKRSELLFKCETAELLLRDAKRKVTDARQLVDLTPRKPPVLATASRVIVMPKRSITA